MLQSLALAEPIRAQISVDMIVILTCMMVGALLSLA